MDTQSLAPLVLVVDDETNARAMLHIIFEREGYRVREAASGSEALKAARELMPDLILLDILMPLMNGFDVLRALRADEQTMHIPTILLTAIARDPSNVEQGLNLGADDFLFKPFHPQELVARVTSKIRAHQLEEALRQRTHSLEALLRVSERLNQEQTLDRMISAIMELLADGLPGDARALHLLDGDGKWTLHSDGEPHDVLNRPAWQAMMSAEPVTWIDHPDYAPFRHVIGTALYLGEERIGVLLTAGLDDPFNTHAVRLFAGIGRQAALALRNAQLYATQQQYAHDLEATVSRKVQELASAHQVLFRAERLSALGRLAAGVAHDMNNSIMPIKLQVEMLIEDLQDTQLNEQRETAEYVREKIERIEHLVKRLLDFGRERTPTLQPLSLNAMLDDMLHFNEKLLSVGGIQVIREITHLPAVHGSQDQLETVFLNLIQNARDAMPEGGTLRVRAFPEDSWAVVEVSDTGSGIEPVLMKRIFEEFFTTKEHGTGIGLFTSREVIAAHQGKIGVASEIGVGTTFTVRLPLHAA